MPRRSRHVENIDIFGFSNSVSDICQNVKIINNNCLAITHPEISAQWHPTKNGDLTPCDVTKGSNKKVFWLCPEGHDYDALISSRTSKSPSKCPYCSGKRVCIDNCLATIFPEIAEQWHPTKNGDLTPYDVTKGHHKKVWWLCSEGHSYPAAVHHRIRGRGCPYCAGKKACKDNCLATTHPEIAKEWHPTKNGDLTPEDVTFGSDKKVWWLCPKGHTYDAVVDRRTGNNSNLKNGVGCYYCSGKRVCIDNCLATIFPEIAEQWHPTKNGKLTPYDVTSASHRRVWWLCHEGHSYPSAINNKSNQKIKRGCPRCSFGKSEREVGDILEKYFGDWDFDYHKNIWSNYKGYKCRRNCDFWLEKDGIKVMVEYDGEQHFHPVRFNGISIKLAEKSFERQKKIDKLDSKFCKEHGIILHRIRYDENKEESIKRLKDKIYNLKSENK